MLLLTPAIYNSWLDEHLETFVAPQLKTIPTVDPKNDWVYSFNLKKIIALVAIWNQAKVLAKGRTILLPGRDVWLFEVVARMQGDYPTIFRPDISSDVAPYVNDDYSDTMVLDTGYKGSIPRTLKIPNWYLVRYDCTAGGYGSNAEMRPKRQVFPKANRNPYVGLSGDLEGCPKYWTRATMGYNECRKGGKIVQNLETGQGFKNAAMLTMHIAQHVRKVKLVQRHLQGTFV